MNIAASDIFKFLFVELLGASLTSCATMISGVKADIYVDGDVDESVSIISSAGEYKNVTLPTVVEVKRRQLDGQHIHISSEHHSFDDIVLEKTFNEWALVSILSYVTPLCIDLLTNAVSKPKYNQFFITPVEKLMSAGSDSAFATKSVVPSSSLDNATKARLRSQPLSANYPRHEINGTLGFGANQAEHLTKRFVDDIVQPNHMEMEGRCGDIFGDSYVIGKMEYHYRLNRKWDVGAMVAWGKSSMGYTDEYYYFDEQHKKDFSGFITIGGQTCRSFSLAPSVRYTWHEKNACRWFSRVALGAMRNHLVFDLEKRKYNEQYNPVGNIVDKKNFDEKKWRLAYQISVLGICVGVGPIRLVAELGYGCLGVFNIGLGICL